MRRPEPATGAAEFLIPPVSGRGQAGAGMKLCRFLNPQGQVCVGLSLDGQTVLDLSLQGVNSLEEVLEDTDPLRRLENLSEHNGRAYRLPEVRLLAPVTQHEVWAAGVTYLRSRKARVSESESDSSAYERVYEAERPELFFKALPHKVVAPGDPVGIRRDSRWNVPEPELALVLNSRGGIVGYTIGNDMSSRSIEGENLLYLPQAKVYDRACALGPWILLGRSEAQMRRGKVSLSIRRGGQEVFSGTTPLANLRRPLTELAQYLFRSQSFPHGAVLLTGTGIIPPSAFTLRPGDLVRIEISSLGILENPVVEV